MAGKTTNKSQARYTLTFKAQELITEQAELRGLTPSETLEQMIKEWLDSKDKPLPKSVPTPIFDRTTANRVNELQKTVELLVQRVQEITLRERLTQR